MQEWNPLATGLEGCSWLPWDALNKQSTLQAHQAPQLLPGRGSGRSAGTAATTAWVIGW